MFDEFEAPLFFVRSDQINCQVPYEVAGRSKVTVKVIRNEAAASSSLEIPTTPAAPGFFTHASGSQVVAVYPDGDFVSEVRPAKEGEILILFATGGGPLSPDQGTGLPASPPLGVPTLPYEVRIGGETATVEYFGAAPGFVGLLQLNVRMNRASGRASVALRIGEASSDPAAYLFAK